MKKRSRAKPTVVSKPATLNDLTTSSIPSDHHQKISAKTHKYCFSCGRQASLQICLGCGKAGYCSKECQKRDWCSGGHRYRCKKLAEPVVFSQPVIRLLGVDVVPVP